MTAPRVPRQIREALDGSGLTWLVEPGRRHSKVRLAGRLVGIIPRDGRVTESGRGTLNVVAQIRRVARETREESGMPR